jgi:hypothetical protein
MRPSMRSFFDDTTRGCVSAGSHVRGLMVTRRLIDELDTDGPRMAYGESVFS